MEAPLRNAASADFARIPDSGVEVTAIEHLLGRLRQTTIPDVVYHYTSPRGLLGLIDACAVWATDVRYLNDSQEYQYALELVKPAIADLRLRMPATDAPLLDEFERGLEIAPRVRMYVASFSELPDLLSQWRAYCPAAGGFAVGITPKVLMETTQCLLTPCVYEAARQTHLIHELAGVLLNEFRAAPREEEPERLKRLVGLGAEFLGGLTFLAAVFKHPGFSEELEWRLILRGLPGQDPRICFREGRSGIVPYISLPIGSEGQAVRIDEVIVGPNPHVELARQAVHSLLDSKGVTHDGVRTSNVPYRTW